MSTIEKNGLITAVDESGNKNLIYPITRINAVKGLEEKITEIDDSCKIIYASCATAAATQVKEVTLDDTSLSLKDNDIIAIKFAYNNSFNCSSTNGYVTFKIGTDSYEIYTNTAKGKAYGTNPPYYGAANNYIFYKVDATNKGLYHLFHAWDSNTTYSNASLGQGYGTCSTAEATKAKEVSLSGYALVVGGIVSVKFKYAVPASATMNINNKGKKAIYHKGAAIKSGVIEAGDIATFIYNGSQYHLISIDKVSAGGLSVSVISETDYNALTTKSTNILYFVTS